MHDGVPMTALAPHDERVARLRDQVRGLPDGAPVRLAKGTSNLFRTRTGAGTLDVSDLTHVLHVDPDARTADVEGMVTYEQLVDATLRHGLMPMVVPQLKTITLGGAVAGLGIESASFRNGMPHESVLELELLTGDGEVVLARPDNEHRDLFHGFPNSYGTLGYTTRVRIALEPVRPFVRLRHVRHDSAESYFAQLDEVCTSRSLDGEPADFVDGTVFGADEHYLTVGTFTDEAPYTSDYTWLDIYYHSVRARGEDYLSTRDYLWRWDTDWFWCAKALGVENRLVRRLLGRKRLRSDVYWKAVAFERRHDLAARWERLRGRPDREVVVQDIEVPLDRAADFLAFLHKEVPISPVWVCPIRQRDRTHWPLYDLDPATLYVNFGFWSSVALDPGEPADTHNRLIERTVSEMDGRKSLYSASFYPRDEFWSLYNGPVYHQLKERYDPGARLPDLYDKCVRGR